METTKTRTKTHSAIFTDKDAADAAYSAAIKRGYKPEEINVVMSDATRKKFYLPSPERLKTETGDKSMEGLALGGALGGTVVGVLGAIVALTTTIVIPPLGLVVAGPLAAGLVGAGVGSITGGLIGALIGAGVPEEHATLYESDIKQGGILITVASHSDEVDTQLLQDWKDLNGKDLY